MVVDEHKMNTKEPVGLRNLRGSKPGTPVFDEDGILLGTVASAYDVTDPVLERVASALEFANIASMIVARIRQTGCLEVYGGTSRNNYYVLPDQIEEVTQRGVFLNASRVALIHL